MHAKRRDSLAKIVGAARAGGLGVVKMAKFLPPTSIQNNIKRCDRLLSNVHLHEERMTVYRALAHKVLQTQLHIAVSIDWSELRSDGSMHLLRAAVAIKGRAFTIYEEVHPQKLQGSAKVHLTFMKRLKTIVPKGCEPVIVTDAGFKSTWFRALDKLGFSWVGRIRNRDMVCPAGGSTWTGCKGLYDKAKTTARNLGNFLYVRSNPTKCQLVIVKKRPQGRKSKNKLSKPSHSQRSKKARAAQTEPWLLAASPRLNALSAQQVERIYATRMQIEQTFRDLKNEQWGTGLSTSQTRSALRLSILVLIAALLMYALWIVGLSLLRTGNAVTYGSKAKASSALSVISLASYWLNHATADNIDASEFGESIEELARMVYSYAK